MENYLELQRRVPANAVMCYSAVAFADGLFVHVVS